MAHKTEDGVNARRDRYCCVRPAGERARAARNGFPQKNLTDEKTGLRAMSD